MRASSVLRNSVGSETLTYIAGFLDGDGSLLAQIVRGRDYRFGFTVRVSIVFYQKSASHWFLLWLRSQFMCGYVRLRPDGMSEYTIVGKQSVGEILRSLQPHLRLKRELSQLILQIIERRDGVSTAQEFLDLCRLVDKTRELTYSKNRTIDSLTVERHLNPRRDLGVWP